MMRVLSASLGAVLLAACGSSSDSTLASATGSGGAGTTTSGTTTSTASTTGSGGGAHAGGASGTGGAASPGHAIFDAPEPWTKDVSALAPDARSAAILAALEASGGFGTGELRIDYSIPLFFADASTPRRTIAGADGYCYGGTDCDAVPLEMPLPADGNAEGSADYTCDTSYQTDGQGDCHVLVVATDEKKLYEVYNATGTASGGLTALAAILWDLEKAYPDDLRGDQCTSADAAGLPMAGLLPTADEVAAGTIAHAIRFILPNERIKKGVFVHPATHAGSPKSDDPDAPPYGVRLRLKASFDEGPFGPGERVVLRALKTYGMILSDGGNIAFTFADDRTTKAKWADLGIETKSFAAIRPGDFEVVDLGPEIPRQGDCVRN
jgi:hypothetical protein